MLRTRIATAYIAAAALTLFVGGAAAQDAPASAPAATQPAADAGIVSTGIYAENSFGFEIAIPSDWTYDRARFNAPGEGGLGLCRGRSLSRRATLQFVLYRTVGLTPFDRWMERFKAALLRVPDTTLVAQTDKPAQFPAIELELDATGGGETNKSFYYAVELDPSTFLMIVYSGYLDPSADAGAPRKQFDTLLATLKINYTTERRKAIDEAMARGRDLMLDLRQAAEHREWKDRPLFFELFQSGQPVGYVAQRITRDQRSLDDPMSGGNVKTGLHVKQEAWRFGENGSVQRDKSELFASFDHRSELMENESTPIPGPTAPIQQAITTIEQVIREDDILVTSIRTTLDTKFPDPREPVRAGPTYLGAAWVRVLPMLMTRPPGLAYAFSVYDSQTRGLITHVVENLGERELPAPPGKTDGIASRKVRAFAVSEAYSPTPSLVYVDAAGEILRIDAGDTIMTQITDKEVERRYAARREDARKRLTTLQPQRRPTAPAPAAPPAKPAAPAKPPKKK